MRSRHNRLTKNHPAGALKDPLVDPKALLVDQADHLVGSEVHLAKGRH